MIKTLIVDDIEQNAIMLRVLLENYNHRVTFAPNGMEALDILETKSFDLIISDVLMPRLDGFEFCKRVKQNKETKDIPFIIYTATYMDNESKKYGLSLGADRYLLKPLEPQQLLKTIADLFVEYKNRMESPKEDFIFQTTSINEREIQLLEQMEQGLYDLEKKNKILKRINQLTLDLVKSESLQEYFEILFEATQKYFPYKKIFVTALRNDQFVTIFNKNIPITLKIILLRYIAESKQLMGFDGFIHPRHCDKYSGSSNQLTIGGSCCFLPYNSGNQKGVIALMTEENYNYEYADYFFQNLYPLINNTISKFSNS